MAKKILELAIKSNPDIDVWIMGGHSVGGVIATTVAENISEINGLLIWASYPMYDISNLDIAVLSIYGTNDPFADEKIIDDKKKYLPQRTKYIGIEGGIHEYFGDYTQPDDGQPGIERTISEQQIIQEILKFIESLKK